MIQIYKAFYPEYMQYLQQLNLAIYKVMDKQNGSNFPVINYQEINLPDLSTLSKEELEQKLQLLKGKNLPEEGALEEKSSLDEETSIEEFARKAGIQLSDVKSCSSLDPTEKITDEKSFEDITKTKGMYTKVFMVASNSQTKGNSRFAFWGVTPKGKVEQIEGLEEREGTNTGKEIYVINEDGSCVKEKQTTALFTLEGMQEGFSITIGQYGILEAEYLRKSSTENKYIGSSINTTHQRPTRKQVQEFMNDGKTNKQELDESIEKTEGQLSVSPTTRIENIDNNPNNDIIERQEDREILTPEEQALKNLGLL